MDGGRVMLKFEVKNRCTGAVQYSAEIDCDENSSTPLKLGLAVKWAIETGAYLIDAYLRGANLEGANLIGANLEVAYLEDAYLEGANLIGANLIGANLIDANLIHCGTRSDGHEFYAYVRDGKIWIKAGCRNFEIKEAAKHWRDTRDGTPLGDESQQFLKSARALVKIRKLLEATA
jgi:hypothetical protein